MHLCMRNYNIADVHSFVLASCGLYTWGAFKINSRIAHPSIINHNVLLAGGRPPEKTLWKSFQVHYRRDVFALELD